MTTIVVVRKDALAAIASDALTSFGDMRLDGAELTNRKKLLQVGDSYLGLSGSSAHFEVLESYFEEPRNPRAFGNRREIFETWRKLHRKLKGEYFLNPKDDEHDPYESSQITALMATPGGLYGVFAMREVFEYGRYWAMGSGREYALGALHALYERVDDVRVLAEEAVRAGCMFDKNSGLPVECHVIELKKPPPAPEAVARPRARRARPRAASPDT